MEVLSAKVLPETGSGMETVSLRLHPKIGTGQFTQFFVTSLVMKVNIRKQEIILYNKL